eukprot:3932115-Rhodomonas_salina.1
MALRAVALARPCSSRLLTSFPHQHKLASSTSTITPATCIPHQSVCSSGFLPAFISGGIYCQLSARCEAFKLHPFSFTAPFRFSLTRFGPSGAELHAKSEKEELREQLAITKKNIRDARISGNVQEAAQQQLCAANLTLALREVDLENLETSSDSQLNPVAIAQAK